MTFGRGDPSDAVLRAIDHLDHAGLMSVLSKLATRLKDVVAPADPAPPALTSFEAPPEPEWESNWEGLDETAALRGCHRQTMAKDAHDHGLGFLRNNCWRIDMRRVRAFDNGLSYPKLNPGGRLRA